MPTRRSSANASAPIEGPALKSILRALSRIPGGLFVLTAAHEERQAGCLAHWVQRCSQSPPMVSVPVPKGHPIMPLISESHRFALAQIGQDDRTTRRRFAGDSHGGDGRFLGVTLVPASDPRSGLPIPRTSVGYLECDLAFHVDIEGDHDLFIGRIIAGDAFGGEAVTVSGEA